MKEKTLNLLSKLGILVPLRFLALQFNNRFNKDIIQHRDKLHRFNSQLVSKNDLVFDIGANIGKRTDVFNRLGCKVVSVEPSKDCVRILKWRFRNRIQIVNKGIDTKEGKLKQYISDTVPEVSTFSEQWIKDEEYKSKYTWNRTEETDMTTLDNLIQIYGIPIYCKIDIEGFELNALKGLNTALPLLSFEFNMKFFERAISAMERLQELGDYEFNAVVSLSTEFIAKEWIDKNILIDLLRLLNHKDGGYIYAKIRRKLKSKVQGVKR